jgi:hypothetical protein
MSPIYVNCLTSQYQAITTNQSIIKMTLFISQQLKIKNHDNLEAYGRRRMKAALADDRVDLGVFKISRLMKEAVKAQQPDISRLMFYSDRGVQYSANLFKDTLSLHGITPHKV